MLDLYCLVFVTNVAKGTIQFKRLDKAGFLTENPDARGKFTFAEVPTLCIVHTAVNSPLQFVDVMTALELQMMELGSKLVANSSFIGGAPVTGKVTDFIVELLETESFSHGQASEVCGLPFFPRLRVILINYKLASGSIFNAAEQLCTDKRQGDFIVEYTPSGYESQGKEETLYAHFSAKGLQLASYEILRLFPPQIILHVIRDRGLKRLGILATAASLVSPSGDLVHIWLEQVFSSDPNRSCISGCRVPQYQCHRRKFNPEEATPGVIQRTLTGVARHPRIYDGIWR